MAEDVSVVTWEEIEPLIDRFCIWTEKPEIAWFKKAWASLAQAGLTTYANDVDRHWVFIRGIALGVMYADYCQLEWNEYTDPESLIGELFHDDIVSQITLGAMAADSLDPNEFDVISHFVNAVLYLVGEVRFAAYNALVKGFGDSLTLYAGLRASQMDGENQENLDSLAERLIDESGTLVDGSDEALAYVLHGSMLGIDS